MTHKVTRKLTDIKFEHEGAHVALVGLAQGGAANGHTTLITKATNTIAEETVEKAKEVTVTMQFPEFLRKFFGLYYEDAEVLSVVMGYGKTEYPEYDNGKDWIDEKVASLNIMKSVYRAQDVEKALAALTPEQILALKQDQETLEKALDSASEQTNKQEETTLETILKSAHEEALATVKTEAAAELAAVQAKLEVAEAAVAKFEQEAVVALEKSRKEAIAAAGVAADQVEDLFKSTLPLDAEAFAKTLAFVAPAQAVDKDMLVEKGARGAAEPSTEVVDRTLQILKERYQAK